MFLTPQSLLPKLRLSKHMQSKSQRIRILALLLGVVFLAPLSGLFDSRLGGRRAVAQNCHSACHEPARSRSFGRFSRLSNSLRHLSPRPSCPLAFCVSPIAVSTFATTRLNSIELQE